MGWLVYMKRRTILLLEDNPNNNLDISWDYEVRVGDIVSVVD